MYIDIYDTSELTKFRNHLERKLHKKVKMLNETRKSRQLRREMSQIRGQSINSVTSFVQDY